MSALVSVITVTWNSARTIRDAIESVLSQDYASIEHVVIDGGSTDGTIDIVRSYGNKIGRFVSEKDGGIYWAMNKGLKLSRGSMVLFINSDDRFASSKALGSLVEARRRYPADKPTICYSDFIKYYPTLNRSLLIKPSDSLKAGFSLCHQAMLVDRTAYDRAGPFDTSFRFAADHEWTVRAARCGVCLIRAEIAPTVVFRHGGASDANYWASRMESGRVILREYGRLAHLKYTLRQFWVASLRYISRYLVRIIGERNMVSLQTFYFGVFRRHKTHDSSTID